MSFASKLVPGEVALRSLGDVGQFTRGRRFTKADLVEDGLPCIHYGEIYTHYGVAATSAISHVRRELAPTLRFAKTGDVVFAAVGETVEDVGKSVAWLGDEDVAVHDDCFIFRSSLDPKFVAYFTQTEAFNKPKEPFVARAKIKRLSSDGLARLQIPVPPIDVQHEVVALLDRLADLKAELRSKLNAELDAREAQLSHYRDQLFAFRGATV